MTKTTIRVLPVMLVVLWLAPPGRAAAPCAVPSGTHPTIQSAVDDPSCDPINVGAGVFNENVMFPRSVQVNGAGTTSTTIDGTGGTVINISGATPKNVGMSSLTVTGGGSGGPAGGGFQVEEGTHTLTLTDVAVTGNVGASEGGGLAILDESTLVMTGGEISRNEVSGAGGAIVGDRSSITLNGVRVESNKADTGGAFYIDTGSLEIHQSRIESNESTGLFGGFQAFALTSAVLTDTTIVGNTAALSIGGASASADTFVGRNLLVDGNSGTDRGGLEVGVTDSAILEDSAITNNTATDGDSGGLRMASGTEGTPLTLVNTTISGNRASEDGGGLVLGTGTFTGTNLTISNNAADFDQMGIAGDGGGIVKSGTGSATIRNTILFGNTDGSPGANFPECHGPVVSGGSNIIGTLGECPLTPQSSDKVGVDPLLMPLADNGGDTLTHALLPGSPATNAADPAFAPPTDQRGAPRNPDIGAYELVFCKKVVVNEVGTEGNDTLIGGSESNGVLAGGGNDTVNTGGGKDAVCAGAGKDRVNGGGGKDRLLGQAGKDKLKGGGGRDVLSGGPGKDTCNGGGGRDKAACEKERKI